MAVSWLAKGAASVAIAEKEVAVQEAKIAEYGKMRRFWLGKGEQGCQITFVDGNLDATGVLVPDRYYEHNLFLDGHYGNYFVCPAKTAPHLGFACPICVGGDNPTLVSLFTVIDHREFKSQKDSNKVYRDEPKLFVAKKQTMEMLQTIALKRGGLAGCKFDVTRANNDKSPAVGTMFDFCDKTDVAILAKQPQYWVDVVDPKNNAKSKKCIFVPADYETEISFKTPEQLAALGFGGTKISGFSSSEQKQLAAASDSAPEATDYSSQL